jgi:glutamate-1-semialdehyde 2,1-aminomutase
MSLRYSSSTTRAPNPVEGDLQRRAHTLIPGGCHTYAKGDDQYPIEAPAFIARGSGCHVWDVDGNKFIEYGMGNRAVGLGHAFPAVIQAAAAQLQHGCNFTRPSSIEVLCAEKLLSLLPSADMVKFCKDGSDATSGAVRLARAYTGRDKIAICADHPFFSTDDWFIGTTAMDAGIPESVKKLTVGFRYNNLASLRALFEAHPGEIAACILEPARNEEPQDGFLEGVQTLCRQNGTLLIFDEMITGFRWNNGGAQAVYGVEPDLSCWGKALANGFSVSALAGKREFMRLGGLDHTDKPRVFLLSTTHGAETHALAAAIANMEIYEREPVIEHNYAMGERLRQGFEAVTRRRQLQDHVKISGRSCCLTYATLDADKKPSQAMRTLFLQETIRRGVLMPSLVVSYAHTEDDIDATIDAIDGALGVYADALAHGVQRYLVGRPSQIVYRKFNTADVALG